MSKHTVALSLWWSGAWHTLDATAGVTVLADTVSASRGYTAEGTHRPASITCRIRDDVWRFDPDNEASDLYGLIGPRTPAVLIVDSYPDASGEVSEWNPGQTQEYHPAGGGQQQRGYRFVDLVVSGVTRRIGSWPLRLETPMRRANLADVSWAYYPCEDDVDASRLADLAGGKPATIGGLKLATRSGPLGAGQLPEVQPAAASAAGQLARPAAAPTVWQESFALNGVGADFSATPDWITIYTSNGYRVRMQASATSWSVWVQEPQGVTDSGTPFYAVTAADDPTKLSVLWALRFTTGASTTARLRWAGQQAAGWNAPADYTWAGWDIGYPVAWQASSVPKSAFGHVRFVAGATPDLVDDTLRLAFDAYAREPAGVRWMRLLNQAGFADLGFQGEPALTQWMGPQRADTLPELLKECAVTEDAIATELPGTPIAPFFRTRRFLYENEYFVPWVLQYPRDIAPPFSKVLDDVEFANVVRVKQREGSEVIAQQTTGPYGTATVGEEQTDVNVNVAFPEQDLEMLARYWLNRRFLPGARYPQVTIDFERNPELAQRAAITEIGALLQVTGFRPNPVLLRVIGKSAVTLTHRRKITFTCLPFPSGRIGQYDTPAYRYDVRGCTLAVGVSPTATSLQLDTLPLEPWTTKAASMPFVLQCDGEWIRVTGMSVPTGVTNRQLATVVRSVNGISKSHTAGAAVSLAEPTYYAR